MLTLKKGKYNKLYIPLIFFPFSQSNNIMYLIIVKFNTELYKDEPVEALYSKLFGLGVGGCHKNVKLSKIKF